MKTDGKKYLFMISQNYPYGKGEVYLERELKAFSEYYEKIVLLPMDYAGEANHRTLPANVELSDLLLKRDRFVDKKVFLKNILDIRKVLKTEKRHTKAKAYLKANKKEFAGQVTMAIKNGNQFTETFLSDKAIAQNASFYSVWLDESALMLALLKEWGVIPEFVVRLHGYDLFDNRREGNYMPFQGYVFERVKRIFIVSQAGYDYLAAKGKFIEKLQVNYSGVYDHGINPLPGPGTPFTLLSVSNMVALKRIDRIMEVLKRIEGPIRWIHIGDGEERDKLEALRQQLPDRIAVEWTGAVPFQQILELYQTTCVHGFIHLSETEGLPMAVVEAQSFGIPAIATDVGGTREIVTEGTGTILPVDFTLEQAVQAINELKKVSPVTMEYRQAIKARWNARFNADQNYRQFITWMNT